MGRIAEIQSIDEYRSLYGDDRLAVAKEMIERLKGTGGLSPMFAMHLHDPTMAKRVADFSDYVVGEMPWAQRADLRELVFQMVNKRLRCESSHLLHYQDGLRAGLSGLHLASLDFPDSNLFTDEQRLVLKFTNAALDQDVPDELFEEARSFYGDKGMIEFTVLICLGVWWAVVYNVLQPEADTSLVSEVSASRA